MSSSNTFETVTNIITNTFDLEEFEFKAETSAEDIDEWDSLSHIELITSIESHYKIRFALGELQDLKNIGDMVTLIESKIN